MESLGRHTVRQKRLPWGASGAQKTSQDLDLALGLRSAGHCVWLLLFAEGVVCEREVFRNVPQEQGHLGIWPANLN